MVGEIQDELISKLSVELTRASTTALDVSFNELLDMHEGEELDITPDYQRLFRWSEGQRSRFIESLLLEMPVPPIFVIEVEEGRYQLIDGLQRISSYLHFRGALMAPHLPNPVEKGDFLELSECDIVPELNGKSFQDFPTALQIRVKRSFIRMEVVRAGADPHFKYHMFKRLNTGGEQLSEQQIRNCAIRMLSSEFPDFLIDSSRSEAFEACMPSHTQERELSAYREELVLRFFALKNSIATFKHEVSEFLTDYMEIVADPVNDFEFDFDGEKAIFEKTFSVLERSIGDKAFCYARDGKLTRAFGIYHYEAVTIGLQRIIDQLNPDDAEQMKRLGSELERIKLDDEFIQITTGGGKNSPGPLNARINFVGDALNAAF